MGYSLGAACACLAVWRVTNSQHCYPGSLSGGLPLTRHKTFLLSSPFRPRKQLRNIADIHRTGLQLECVSRVFRFLKPSTSATTMLVVNTSTSGMDSRGCCERRWACCFLVSGFFVVSSKTSYPLLQPFKRKSASYFTPSGRDSKERGESGRQPWSEVRPRPSFHYIRRQERDGEKNEEHKAWATSTRHMGRKLLCLETRGSWWQSGRTKKP
jgi:hypothetical protein